MNNPEQTFRGEVVLDPYKSSVDFLPTFLFSGAQADHPAARYSEPFHLVDTRSLSTAEFIDDIRDAGGALRVTLEPGTDKDVGIVWYERKPGDCATGGRVDARAGGLLESLTQLSADASRNTTRIPSLADLPEIPRM
jgi:hypothetical protein